MVYKKFKFNINNIKENFTKNVSSLNNKKIAVIGYVILDEYIMWKICENNSHIIILYNKDKIKAFSKVKKRSNIFVSDYSIGSKQDIDMIVNCINETLIKKSCYDIIRNIFVYQTKVDLKIIKDIMSLNNKNLKNT